MLYVTAVLFALLSELVFNNLHKNDLSNFETVSLFCLTKSVVTISVLYFQQTSELIDSMYINQPPLGSLKIRTTTT